MKTLIAVISTALAAATAAEIRKIEAQPAAASPDVHLLRGNWQCSGYTGASESFTFSFSTGGGEFSHRRINSVPCPSLDSTRRGSLPADCVLSDPGIVACGETRCFDFVCRADLSSLTAIVFSVMSQFFQS